MLDLAKYGRDCLNERALNEIKDHAKMMATNLYVIGEDEAAAKFQKLADAIFELYLD